jgi:hypothetical protein
MSQIDLAIYTSVLESAFFFSVASYLFFITFLLYPLTKKSILSKRLFVKVLNDILFIYFYTVTLASSLIFYKLELY